MSSETSSKKVRNERQHGVCDDRSHDSDEDDCEDNVQGNQGARRVLNGNGSKTTSRNTIITQADFQNDSDGSIKQMLAKMAADMNMHYNSLHERIALVFQWCCSTPQGSPGVGRNTFLSSPHLCFIIVFICDLFVSRDDPLMS